MNTRALMGKKVLITRAMPAGKKMASLVEAHGGEPILAPVMTFKALSLTHDEKKQLNNLARFDWLVFTSANGVQFFFEEMGVKALNVDVPKIAVVGTKTEEALNQYGIHADFIPETFSGEALIEAFSAFKQRGRVLLLLGKLAKTSIQESLKKAGYEPFRIDVYDTEKNDKVKGKLIDIVKHNKIDAITFTSPSSIRFFHELISDFLIESKLFWDKVVIACIGDVTAECAKKYGLIPSVVPHSYTTEALIEELANHMISRS